MDKDKISAPPISDDWGFLMDSDHEITDTERFNNADLLKKKQIHFFDCVIASIEKSRTDKTQDHLLKNNLALLSDGEVNYLLANIKWVLSQNDPQPAQNLFKRLNNNFHDLTENEPTYGIREMIIRMLGLLLFELYLQQNPTHRDKLIVCLFEVNDNLAKDLDQATKARGIKRILQTITGKTTNLIGHDDNTGALQLQIENQSKQLLLTGPPVELAKIEKPAPKLEYPGHIHDPEIVSREIDELVKNKFDINAGMQAAVAAKKEAIALGMVFTVIGYILRKEIPFYAVTEDKTAQLALKPFRLPERLKDEQANIFGNIVTICLEKSPQLKPAIYAGINQLVGKNRRLFEGLQSEFFYSLEAKTDNTSANQATDSQPKPTIIKKTKPTIDPTKPENLVTLDPLNRLEKIYQSGMVDFRQLATYDTYAREVLSLILCGLKNPSPEQLTKGYLTWQKLVHPDKNPSKLAESLSREIGKIASLVRKQEFLKEEAQAAVTSLFELVQQMLDECSITIIPRQGERHIILSNITIGTILKQQQYNPEVVKVFFRGQLVDNSQFDQTVLTIGDLIEVVTF